ncbi:hypothetical protein [Actinophytocola sediminis]
MTTQDEVAVVVLEAIVRVDALQLYVRQLEVYAARTRVELADARAELAELAAQIAGVDPCEVCGRPRTVHVCGGCSPNPITPGKGCDNCRHTGWNQTPCLPLSGSSTRSS